MIRILAVLIPLLLLTANSEASDNSAYWVDANVRVLAYVGKIGSKDWQPRVFYTYETQRLRHIPRSRPGRGVRSFYLTSLVVKGEAGERLVIEYGGWIVVKNKFLRITRYRHKRSMKIRTRRF